MSGPAVIPIDADAVAAAAGPPWRVAVVAETGSTNADLVARCAGESVVDEVLIAERQTAGRGRLGREWSTPAGAQVAMSLVVEADRWRSPNRLGWVPLAAGIAVTRAIGDVTGIVARLKWPNDVLVDGAKVAGILAELAYGPRPSVVVGVGVNTGFAVDALPVPTAGSLNLASDAEVDRSALAGAVLAHCAIVFDRLDHDPDGVRADYLAVCDTVGRRVRVDMPVGDGLIGTAIDIDESGRIVVREHTSSTTAVAAGDVTHLRAD